ncbi:MAG TPA: hypothetical protein P5186_27460 [Candidatus Paceibacterota bacterium]|nr:hypothetical protein [Verrucomicrobiota bacterium]HRY51792.1 hypothetical protein [Candidatus Paceibacterota bacterium]HSA00843.1 hypothetical protein [Candidatus Paceibacterota bacterium]
MPRITTITIVTIATFAAAAAVWFWALRPLGSASYLSATGATDADVIRQYWPHRLVEPEWVSATPDRFMKWHMAEAIARLSVVGVVWLIISGGAILRFTRGRRQKPNKSVETNRRPASPLDEGRKFESTSCAPPSPSAAVAHL